MRLEDVSLALTTPITATAGRCSTSRPEARSGVGSRPSRSAQRRAFAPGSASPPATSAAAQARQVQRGQHCLLLGIRLHREHVPRGVDQLVDRARGEEDEFAVAGPTRKMTSPEKTISWHFSVTTNSSPPGYALVPSHELAEGTHSAASIFESPHPRVAVHVDDVATRVAHAIGRLPRRPTAIRDVRPPRPQLRLVFPKK